MSTAQLGLFDAIEEEQKQRDLERLESEPTPWNLGRMNRAWGFQNCPKDYMDLQALFPELELRDDLITHAAAAAMYRYATHRDAEFRWNRKDMPETFSDEGAEFIRLWWTQIDELYARNGQNPIFGRSFRVDLEVLGERVKVRCDYQDGKCWRHWIHCFGPCSSTGYLSMAMPDGEVGEPVLPVLLPLLEDVVRKARKEVAAVA